MILLLGFSFLAGLVTIASPCILPILPIVLSGALSGGKWRPLGVVAGFILSFTFFAVFSFALAKAFGISTGALRNLSVILLIVFGLSIFVPRLQLMLENFASRFSGGVGQKKREGFAGGVVLGLSLGLVWTPCVGPILASVLTLAATSQITTELVLITLAFSLGTALPMLAIGYGGKHVLETLPALRSRSAQIQKVFGVLIIGTALLIYFNLDRKFQTYILGVFPQYGKGLTSFEKKAPVLDRLKDMQEAGDPAPNHDFVGATKWLNSEPLSLDTNLKGKVVLVDFWTYTCINCIRTLPYITSWYKTYKDDGFVVVGVHTPEFEFEKDEKNVLQAMKDFGITYPVVQDNDFGIWQSYNNQYWPAHYLIDRNGKIRYTHFGEGEYDTTEDMIRTLLAESGGKVTGANLEMPDMTPEGERTPETYLGYARIDRFASVEQIVPDKPARYTLSPSLPTHYFAYGGTWTVGDDPAVSSKGSELELAFQGNDVYLVMHPGSAGMSGSVEVYLDGKLVDSQHAGADVKNGKVLIDQPRLYKLLHIKDYDEHLLRLKFIDNPVKVFAFTFG